MVTEQPGARRILKRLALLVAALVVAFEVALQLALNLGVIPALLNRDGRTQIGWSLALSAWPTRIWVGGFFLERREGFGSWRLLVDRAAVDLDLPQLFEHNFVTKRIDAHGVGLRFEKSDAPLVKRAAHKRRWGFALHGMEVHGLRELTVSGVSLASPLEGGGDFVVTSDREMTLRNAHLAFRDGVLTGRSGSKARLDHLDVTAEVTSHALPGQRAGYVFLAGLGGTIDVAASWDEVDWLAEAIARDPDLVDGGAGRLAGVVRVERGALTNGTRLEAVGERLSLRAGPVLFSGPYAFNVTVPGHASPPHLVARVAPLDVGAVDDDEIRPLLTAPALDLTLDAQGRRILELFASYAVTASAGPASFAPRGDLGPWTGHAIQLKAGQISLDAKLRVPLEPGETMKLRLDGRKLVGRWGRTAFTGAFTASIGVGGSGDGEPGSYRGALAVELRDVRLPLRHSPGQPFAASLSLRNLHVRRSDRSLEGLLQGRLSDLSPLAALLADRGKVPTLLEPLVRRRSIDARARLRAGRTGVAFDDVDLRSGGVKIRGRVKTRGGDTSAVLLLDLNAFDLGVSVDPKGTHVQLWRAERWFREQS